MYKNSSPLFQEKAHTHTVKDGRTVAAVAAINLREGFSRKLLL